MAACPSCHATVADDARFCASCGSPLAAAQPVSVPAPRSHGRRERRIVTSLFCDLVGFTSQSEAADPEDLDRMLEAYFALAREAIERHGGVVEKFIGDAVVGVFGVPVAHEDDPARAVRAGLTICEGAAALRSATGEPLRLRVGINTGETFAHLDVDPASGEHVLVGDAVNTAARIQSAAPELGVAVGATTWEATNLAFAYEELAPASLKGKAEPVRLFHARGERATRGVDPSRTHAGPYVGRDEELARLGAAFDAVRASRVARLAVITGEPGIGKSRLLAELERSVRARDPGVTWRQGRCLPYGDGTGFWSLAEIVKTHAGILDADDAATATARLDATLEGLPERPWLRERLLPLLGIESGGANRDELSDAWSRYLRSMARTGPAVVAFEDVHWADPALLALIADLAACDSALLVVVTARPEVDQRAPELARGEGIVRVDLAPLGDADTEALVVGLLGSVVPAELHAPILRLSEGNPLYAEELVRLLGDRDLLVVVDGEHRLRPGAEIPLPGSIHGLLASRLDTLEAAERDVVAAASVVGHVFWPGAVSAIAGRTTGVEAALAALASRQLVRRATTTSMTGEDEYAFWHGLARDVAYGTLARGARLDAHLATADWIRSREGRRDDVAGVVAHHLSTALELAIAAGDRRAVDIRPAARSALADAAAATIGLDVDAATALYARAVDLAEPGTPDRAAMQVASGIALRQAARHPEALAALEEAIDTYRAAGDDEQVAATMLVMLPSLQAVQDYRWVTLPEEAQRLLEPAGPSELLIDALIARSRAHLWDWSWDGVRRYADEAIEMAEGLGLPPPPRALGARGWARLGTGDAGGMDDCRQAVDAATAAGEWDQAAAMMQQVAAMVAIHEGLRRQQDELRDAIAMCDAHGLRALGYVHRTDLAASLMDTGDYDEVIELTDSLAEAVEAGGDVISAAWLFGCRSHVAMVRGDLATARRLLPRIVAIADANPEQDDLHPTRLQAVAILLAIGDRAEARRLLEVVIRSDVRGPAYEEYAFVTAVRLALELDDTALAGAAIPAPVADTPMAVVTERTARAVLDEARGEMEAAAAGYAAVAPVWRAQEMALEAAEAFLGAARTLHALGRDEAAAAALTEAHALFGRLEATPRLAEVEALEAQLAVPRS